MPDARTQEIASEQQVVDRVYDRTDTMRTQAQQLAKEGHGRAAAGPAGGLVERDAMVHHAAGKLRSLDAEAEGLVFGRLDLDDGETYHIGRLGVRDEDREPLLIDWRAPAAAAFYRATPGEPLGVVRRRVIISRGREVVDLDDDLLTPDDAGDLRVLGEGSLLAALQRARGPQMRDIVTTIQREQDEAIRAPARGVTLITGGPGTGKTQVALHRAAYLLYTDRGRFADGRVLVVGPSTVFTNYISRVLPALGEDSIHLRAIGELVDGVTATRRDPAPVAEIKGSTLLMDAALAELIWQAPPTAPDHLKLVYAGQVIKLGHAELRAVREVVRTRAAASGTLPNSGRPLAAKALLEALWAAVDGEHLERELFVEDVGDRPEFRRFLAAWWPRLTPADVLAWLGDAHRVRGVLGDEAAEALAASYHGRTDWSVDDVPLLDELDELLGEPPAAPKAQVEPARLRELTMGPQLVDTFVLSCGLHDGWSLYAPGLPTPMAVAGQSIDNDASAQAQRWAAAIILREGHQVVSWIDGFDPYGEDGYVPVLAEPLPVAEPDDEPATWDDYAHVILDESQDLSPMECRMIGRRAAYASMTIVGDLGQATHPLAAPTWQELLARLDRRDARMLDLRTGYRVPQVLADYAARVLAPGIEPTQSYRPGGELSVRQVDDLAAAVRDAARAAPGEGSVAVVVADHMSGAIVSAVDAPHVTVVPAGLVKGLEYDHVIVVEPAEIVAAESRGQQRLYVVLTRAVARLEVLHHQPLPAVLAAAAG
ncbi:HelD family protein [Catellatospora vulcania]|uniref:HelD family protein n=1 Tax=Catellatospora vulcania TaxID=1460450 RepID=UPI001E4669B8|nr:UvrD-helicase domain-containing protein [Catellatospora vulcania]